MWKACQNKKDMRNFFLHNFLTFFLQQIELHRADLIKKGMAKTRVFRQRGYNEEKGLFIVKGNNPMVGMTAYYAVAVNEALNK